MHKARLRRPLARARARGAVAIEVYKVGAQCHENNRFALVAADSARPAALFFSK